MGCSVDKTALRDRQLFEPQPSRTMVLSIDTASSAEILIAVTQFEQAMAIYLSKTPKIRELDDDPQDSRRRRDPEATRRAILDAAEELFVCHGPAATSMSQVANKAGVTKSLIHHHFGSKDELWSEVQQRHFEEYFEIQMQLLDTGDSTADLLEESIVAYFRFLQRNPKSVRFRSWTFVEEEDEQHAHVQEKQLFEIGIEKIREAQAEGTIRADLEPFFIIKTLIALPFSWFQTQCLTLSMVDSDIEAHELDERYLRDMVKIFLEGVRP
ncbi:MAG: TetR/AcrR family transcriptional regulator, partial [Holophagales bacterium]|nr:TetR/AcrR family transcriptional regulator [Holophagales bacterium]